MLNIRKNKGFSLAEMMVVMLMLSIIFAAAAPILTKRATQTAEVKASGGSGVPVGTIIIWASSTLPQGDEAGKWLECNGQSTASYPELKSVVGENVPNYQGMFLRGKGSQSFSQNNGSNVGKTSTTYSSGALGSIQGDAIRNITGSVLTSSRAWTYAGAQAGVVTGAFKASNVGETANAPGQNNHNCLNGLSLDASFIVPTSTENRPVNMAVMYLIKAKS